MLTPRGYGIYSGDAERIAVRSMCACTAHAASSEIAEHCLRRDAIKISGGAVTASIKTEKVSIEVVGEQAPMPAYLTYPADLEQPLPAVIVFGLGPAPETSEI